MELDLTGRRGVVVSSIFKVGHGGRVPDDGSQVLIVRIEKDEVLPVMEALAPQFTDDDREPET